MIKTYLKDLKHKNKPNAKLTGGNKNYKFEKKYANLYVKQRPSFLRKINKIDMPLA